MFKFRKAHKTIISIDRTIIPKKQGIATFKAPVKY